MYSESEVTDMFTTIVVGVDGLPGGRDALALAQRIGDLAGGELVAVHVHPYEPLPMRGLRIDVEALAQKEAQALLEGQLAEAGVGARAIATAETSPGRGLHRIAEGLEADLIVIGSPHRGPLGRVVAGDTARAVIQGATRPVLVARQSAATPFAGRTIGVGYDGSAESRAALAWAGRFALAVGATVHVLCATEPPQGFSPSISYGINWVALAPERREYAETLVAEAVAELGNGATGEAVVGAAREELVRLSEHVELLVLGSRGYGPLRRTLLGSSADRIVHAAACPVVVVPRGDHENHAAEHPAAIEVTAG
jgi:nucleotide-binding universal stress UspA family protein